MLKLCLRANRPRLRRDLIGALSAAAFTALSFSAPLSFAADPAQNASRPAAATQVAALNSERLSLPETAFPEPLALRATDADLYARIFALQAQGDMKGADRLIPQIDDQRLMGHVLAERYLHPTAWRSTYAELRAWLEAYPDHPQAERIHALASKRRPKNAAFPAPPTAREPRSWRGDIESFGFRAPPTPKAAKAAKGKTTKATRLYQDGANEDAYALAVEIAESVGEPATQAMWIAGLAAWRMERYDDAARWFDGVAASRWSSPWVASGGAFWSARAHLRAGRPEKVVPLLVEAARHPRTFYGLLAGRALGFDLPFDWSGTTIDAAQAERLARVPGAARAAALAQVGRHDLAEDELRRVDVRRDRELERGLAAIAATGRMPGLAMEFGNALTGPDGAILDAALYPIPPWEPEGGYELDRALIWAFMRQESRFQTKARSYAGALGLMQLMPATARAMARDVYGDAKVNIRDPYVNVALGERYIKHLLEYPAIDGNLFLAVAAYNSGPGALQRWLRTVDYKDDPLLFIESAPSLETRVFIERVLANYWLYRARLGQPAPSLDALAAGEWPIYTPADSKPQFAGKSATN